MARDFENTDDVEDLSDQELRGVVRARLAEHRGLDVNDIEVHVENGAVRLGGRVGTEAERRIAERVVTDVIVSALPYVNDDEMPRMSVMDESRPLEYEKVALRPKGSVTRVIFNGSPGRL